MRIRVHQNRLLIPVDGSLHFLRVIADLRREQAAAHHNTNLGRKKRS